MENENKIELIKKGLKLIPSRLIKFKKSKNSPIIVSENGEIKELNPFEVEKQLKSENPELFV
jgi:hypothetical protein